MFLDKRDLSVLTWNLIELLVSSICKHMILTYSNKRYDYTRHEVLVRSSCVAGGVIPLIQRLSSPFVETETIASSTDVRAVSWTRHIAIRFWC